MWTTGIYMCVIIITYSLLPVMSVTSKTGVPVSAVLYTLVCVTLKWWVVRWLGGGGGGAHA